MFEKFIKWLAQKYIVNSFNDGYRLKEKQISDDACIFLDFQLKRSINKKIIYCSNEWEDPIFGIVNGFKLFGNLQKPFLSVKNILTNEICYIDCNSYLTADFKMVQTILKLDPFERWNLTTDTDGVNSFFGE